jgi:hypothetical protein
MGLRPIQRHESGLKGTAFRPFIIITIIVALATEGRIFRQRNHGPFGPPKVMKISSQWELGRLAQ